MLPRMGVPGAGLASVISSYLGLVILMVVLEPAQSSMRPYHIHRLSNASAADDVADCQALGTVSGLATMFAMGGFGFVLFVVAKLDHDAGLGVGRTINSTATSNIISVLQLVFISGIAYGTTTATLVSQNMGAKNYDLAEKFANTAARIGILLFLAIGLCLTLGAQPILHFWNPDPQVVAAGVPILRVLGFICPLMAIALVFIQALYGAGNTVFVMTAELILHFACLVPLSYLAGITLGFGLWGVWGALIFYIAMLAAVMSLKFRTGTWKKIDI